jgi:hypothetical protein
MAISSPDAALSYEPQFSSTRFRGYDPLMDALIAAERGPSGVKITHQSCRVSISFNQKLSCMIEVDRNIANSD